MESRRSGGAWRRRLGLPFVDSDAAIEDAAGLSPAEVFERYGEQDFRDGERRLVARLVEGEVRVIATGGGVFVDPRTRELLNERAITVWLDAPVEILAERPRGATRAPLLRNGDPRARSSDSRTSGAPPTREAHIHVKSGNGAHKDVVEAIVRALERLSRGATSLGRRRLFVRQGAASPKRRLPAGVDVAGLALALEPLAIAHPILALDPFDFARVDAARPEARPCP